jgi:hypothetical protein
VISFNRIYKPDLLFLMSDKNKFSVVKLRTLSGELIIEVNTKKQVRLLFISFLLIYKYHKMTWLKCVIDIQINVDIWIFFNDHIPSHEFKPMWKLGPPTFMSRIVRCHYLKLILRNIRIQSSLKEKKMCASFLYLSGNLVWPGLVFPGGRELR